jgi:hypothetical protein
LNDQDQKDDWSRGTDLWDWARSRLFAKSMQYSSVLLQYSDVLEVLQCVLGRKALPHVKKASRVLLSAQNGSSHLLPLRWLLFSPSTLGENWHTT